MSLKTIFRICAPRTLQVPSLVVRRWYASDLAKLDELKELGPVDKEPIYATEEEEEDSELAQKRNKSRLNVADRNILCGRRPYDTPMAPCHNTVKYKKRLLGRYGIHAAGVPVGIAWPTKEELEDAKEYERVAYPHSLREQWKILEEARQEREAAKQKREAELSDKMSKMQKWIQDVNTRVEKKEAALREAVERKEKMVEDIRRTFGYNVPTTDPKFKEMFAQMQQEQKIKMKETKVLMKKEKMLKKLSRSEATKAATTDTTENETQEDKDDN